MGGIVVRSSKFETNLKRVMATSKLAAVDVLTKEGRVVFKEVAKWTPPSGPHAVGKMADVIARKRVARDIYIIYGTPSMAYEEIAKSSPAAAAAFWFFHLRGKDDSAGDIVRQFTGGVFSPFDGGALHRKNFRKLGPYMQSGFRMYVSNPQSLDSFVQQQQSHLWWMTAGWRDPLERIKATNLPMGVLRHASSPGYLRTDISSTRIELAMGNRVKYATDADLARRVRWAMNIRADRMQRNWDDYMKKLRK